MFWLPALVLTIKSHQTNTQCYSKIQLRSISTRRIERNGLYLAETVSHTDEQVTLLTDEITCNFKLSAMESEAIITKFCLYLNPGKHKIGIKQRTTFLESS